MNFKLYRPSNGTEGGFFMEEWCYRCAKDTEDNPCPILGNSLFFGVGDPQYPREWCYDANSEPQCTAFEGRK